MMRKTPAERLFIGFDMSATARAMIWSTIPTDLPEDERRRASTSTTTASRCSGETAHRSGCKSSHLSGRSTFMVGGQR
jgi:hypothetical protein